MEALPHAQALTSISPLGLELTVNRLYEPFHLGNNPSRALA